MTNPLIHHASRIACYVLRITFILLLAACQPTTSVTPAPASDPTAQTTIQPTLQTTIQPTISPTPKTPYLPTLRIGWLRGPDSLNPATAYLPESYAVLALCYDALVSLDQKGQPQPALATNWESSDDGQVWTFHLRQGVKFHDGTPFTARDAAFTINDIHDAHTMPLQGYVAHITKAEALDDMTLRLTLDAPVGNLLFQLSNVFVLPRHIWQKFDRYSMTEFDNNDTIGTGPFRLIERDEKLQQVKLRANPDYWQGEPRVGEVIFKVYPDATNLVQALKAKEIDLITKVPLEEATALRSEPGIAINMMPSYRVGMLTVNVNPKGKGHSALRDPNVRLALAHAIDKAALVDGALLGFGKVGTTLIPPSLGTWHNGEVADVPFDPTKARSLLDAAGYGGTKGLQLRLLVASDFLGNQGKVAAAKIAGWLKDVGITVMVKTMSQQELDSTIFPDYDFDLVLWDWRSDPDPDFLLSVLTAEQLGHWNDAGYSNPRYDALYRQQARTIDPEARRKLVWEMQRIISDDRPYLVLFYEPTAEAYSSDTFVERPAVADGAGVLENLYWLRSVLP